MVHKFEKGVYYLEWRPLNPDGTSVGDFIRDPTFKLKRDILAWQKFMRAVHEGLFIELRLVKDGKILASTKKLR